MTEEHKKGIWFAYIASFLTPFTLLLSGIIAIIYAGYKLDKGTDEIAYSHYYTIIRSFFLFLTFFVVLGVSAATTTGMIAGAEYWVHSDILDKILNVLPFIGGAIAIVAIVVWFAKIINGMRLLNKNQAVKL
ncbi:hypothetical protein C0Z01_03845 [Photobacterium kishitanii]|uniref:MotA/TolQ/ExbB proton channel domain-containing protein n=1 Tax=Photobacterium kishitanii TaxID=318456 RepID=A0A2T3KIH0_9GAMM|nr:hypothetical protein [Photobacterium kishitanii]KJG10147.1 membrane protein [Photobacterium kishitanii]KJG59353.1 membrane protein [Photobacterium kishitanii]KJG62348.1 membrane protein [Photobacterium kishitanii]KJG67506.1 membrane protein [Photobacterium kishitanii]KJG70174.1 membrane protein [Photobacterium kishitanii]